MNIRNLIVLFMVTTGLFAQSIMGTVYDANSRPLEGANVVLVGTDLGDIANDSGAYAMISVPAGTYDLTASFIGYTPITKSVVVGDEDVMAHFILEVGVVALSDVEVLASLTVELVLMHFCVGNRIQNIHLYSNTISYC